MLFGQEEERVDHQEEVTTGERERKCVAPKKILAGYTYTYVHTAAAKCMYVCAEYWVG